MLPPDFSSFRQQVGLRMSSAGISVNEPHLGGEAAAASTGTYYCHGCDRTLCNSASWTQVCSNCQGVVLQEFGTPPPAPRPVNTQIEPQLFLPGSDTDSDIELSEFLPPPPPFSSARDFFFPPITPLSERSPPLRPFSPAAPAAAELGVVLQEFGTPPPAPRPGNTQIEPQLFLPGSDTDSDIELSEFLPPPPPSSSARDFFFPPITPLSERSPPLRAFSPAAPAAAELGVVLEEFGTPPPAPRPGNTQIEPQLFLPGSDTDSDIELSEFLPPPPPSSSAWDFFFPPITPLSERSPPLRPFSPAAAAAAELADGESDIILPPPPPSPLPAVLQPLSTVTVASRPGSNSSTAELDDFFPTSREIRSNLYMLEPLRSPRPPPWLLSRPPEEGGSGDSSVAEEAVSDCWQCAICIEGYEGNQVVKQIPCRHVFHSACISPWLESHKSCPVCRYRLK